jgi:hypothetical protein
VNTAKFTRTVRRPTSLCDRGLSPPISECDKTTPPSESQFPRPSALLWPEAVGFRPTRAFHCSVAEELPARHSTASRYRCWLRNHIEPKWRNFPIQNIKPLLVEDWLKKLDLAPKSKAHLKTLMHVLFNAAMRWELIPYQHNSMSLVRVKDSSKRLKEPKLLTAQEFCALKVQQELLQHSDVRTTQNIYTQAVPNALREANSKVVRLVIPAQVA